MEGLVTMRGGKAPSPEFWRGRRVLVTGHSGFKGGWLTVWLDALEARVSGFSLPPEQERDLFHAAQIGDLCASEFGDVRDYPRFAQAVENADPEVIFHLAAQPLVRRGYDRPLETVEVNVMGAANLLAASARCRALHAVVVVTTDKVYRSASRRAPFVEDDPLGGHDPYSASKAAAEIVVQSFAASFAEPQGRAVGTARAGNVVGGGDWSADRLVPDAIRAFLDKQPLVLRMPEAIRPWQHVIEPLAGYLLFAEALAGEAKPRERAFNFGPSSEQCARVGDVARRLAALWGEGAAIERGLRDSARPEGEFLLLDSGLAQERLDWRPVFTLEDALELSVAWYRLFASGARPAALRALMRDQIALAAP